MPELDQAATALVKGRVATDQLQWDPSKRCINARGDKKVGQVLFTKVDDGAKRGRSANSASCSSTHVHTVPLEESFDVNMFSRSLGEL